MSDRKLVRRVPPWRGRGKGLAARFPLSGVKANALLDIASLARAAWNESGRYSSQIRTQCAPFAIREITTRGMMPLSCV